MVKFTAYMEMMRRKTIRSLVIAGSPDSGSVQHLLETAFPEAPVVTFSQLGISSRDKVLRGPKGLYDFLKENRDKTVVLDTSYFFRDHTNAEAFIITNLIKAAIDGHVSYKTVVKEDSFEFTGSLIMLTYAYEAIHPSIRDRSAICEA